MDSKGLITRSRADAESLPDHVLPYCHDGPSHPDLKSAVAALKPSVLIGISESSQTITFCQDVCQRLATAHDKPIIMPLSLPGDALWQSLRRYGLHNLCLEAQPSVLTGISESSQTIIFS